MKILFATDGLPAATHALKEGLRLLPLSSAEVVVVSVIDPEQRIGGNENAPDDLTVALALFEQAGLKATTLQLRGQPAEAIVEKARELGADLIVVGSNGRGRLGRVLIGSVSDEVVRHFERAVLVIRLPAA